MLPTVDILMITYQRAHYLRRSLPRLLDTCDETMRVWLWHNGEDDETLSVVRAHQDHPRVHRFHHSRENLRLTAPTNWLWTNSDAPFVGKVDDDCLVEAGWAARLRAAHLDNPSFGAIAAWRFPDEDFVPRLANRKIRRFEGGHQLLQNCWVQGSSYLMKRRCIDDLGALVPGQSFTGYCIELAYQGYVNGWYFPFIREDHMDDPRSPHTSLKTDEDLRRHSPLSAAPAAVRTLHDWERQLRRSARTLQRASTDPRRYRGLQGKLLRPMRRGVRRALAAVGR
ncbi:MAG TPA: glycosyltransferase family A protein [Nitriliruptorales bacterium]|nr:glycosyltransferase family A protein [Nitriliruptorales bacterium]